MFPAATQFGIAICKAVAVSVDIEALVLGCDAAAHFSRQIVFQSETIYTVPHGVTAALYRERGALQRAFGVATLYRERSAWLFLRSKRSVWGRHSYNCRSEQLFKRKERLDDACRGLERRNYTNFEWV